MSRPELPAGSIVRDTRTGLLWRNAGAGEWACLNATYAPVAWHVIDSWPELELLVPIPYITEVTDPTSAEAVQHLAEAVLNPVGTMMVQLAQAAGAGVTAVLVEAVKRGRAAGAPTALCGYYGAPDPHPYEPLESEAARG